MSKEYNGIDIAKFICSLLVAAIHLLPLQSYSLFANYILINWLARIAVPFFFVASGYFLFIKTEYVNFDKSIPLKYAKNLLKLYITWTLIYLPLTIRDQIISGEKEIGYALIAWIRSFIVDGYTYLWYIHAVIVAVLILTFLLSRKVSIKVILGGAGLLYFIGLFTQSYFGILAQLRSVDMIWNLLKMLQKIIVTTKNGVFLGFLFVGIGMWFAYKPIIFKTKTAITLLLFSLFLFFTEVMVIRRFNLARGNNVYLFLVPTTFFLFYIVLHIELPPKSIYKHLRRLSTYIYLLHPLVIYVAGPLTRRLTTPYSLPNYCMVVSITILISECIFWVQKRMHS